MIKTCSVIGCGKRTHGKGLCTTHYIARLRSDRTPTQNIPEEAKGRFWDKVEKTDFCWLWTSSLDRGGYGILSVNAYPVKAHRISWVIHYGAIKDDLRVLHRCDNPKCVNPEHLFLGTNRDNNNDRDSKGRQIQGEDHPSAKLTCGLVREIRSRYIKGVRGHGAGSIAKKYGMSKSAVMALLQGKTWKGTGNDRPENY